MSELRQVGNYELLNRIGSGGMGSVYRARQLSMDRIVALKILPPELAKKQHFIDRFQREARASAKLNHPNIVNGIDVGHSDGVYYFAMEYVEGNSIKGILDKINRINEERSILITLSIAQALAHAHLHGIIHRDIKPDNILIDKNGTAKLCDLGLAALQGENKTLTQHGHVVGTPHYISPEQARGDADLDARADLYSLGATLYHMLTGQTMHKGETSVVVMSKHLTEKVTHPADYGVGVSRGLLMVLAKLLTKDKDDRYESATMLVRDLERLAGGKQPKSADLPTSKWPFKGIHQTGPGKKSGHIPAANARVRQVVAPYPPAIKVAVIVAAVVIGGALAIAAFGKKRPPAVAKTTEKNVKPVPAQPQDPMPKVTPPKQSAGFQKPQPIKPTAPAQTAGFRKPAPPPANPVNQPKASVPNNSTGTDTPPRTTTPPVDIKRGPPVIPLPQVVRPAPKPAPDMKYEPSKAVAEAIEKAAALGKEAKFAKSAELLRKTLDDNPAWDELDRNALNIRFEGYTGLAEMKTLVIESLSKQPLDANVILKKGFPADAQFIGGDDSQLKIQATSAGTGSSGWAWRAFTPQQLADLSARTLSTPLPANIALGLVVLQFDRGDEAQAVKALDATSKTGTAKQFMDQLELRDAGVKARKEQDDNIAAFKELNAIIDLMHELRFADVHARAQALVETYGGTACVNDWSQTLRNIINSSRFISQSNDYKLQAGNVALATNGTVVSGPERATYLIDGNYGESDSRSGAAQSETPCEWTIRFPERYLIGELKWLLCDADAKVSYRYQVKDGDATLVDHSTADRRGWQTARIGARMVKELRISGFSASDDGPFKMIEFEVHCLTGEQWVAQHFSQAAASRTMTPEKPRAPAAMLETALMLEDYWSQNNIMPLLKPTGSWKFEDESTLVSDAKAAVRIEIPYSAPEEYDLRVVFKRPGPPQPVTLCLSQGGHQFQLKIGEGKNKLAGFDLVDGKDHAENGTKSVSPRGWIETGKRHQVIVQVRKDGVVAFLDAQELSKLSTDYKNVTSHPDWKLSDNKYLGIGHAGGELQVLGIHLVEISKPKIQDE